LREEFNKYADELVGVGAAARLADQNIRELNRRFDQTIASRTQYQTSVTPLINDLERQAKDFKEGGKLFKSEGAEETLNALEGQLEVLGKIRDLEIQRQLDDLRARRDTAVYSTIDTPLGTIGTPSGMMAERQRAEAYALASSAERQAQRLLEEAIRTPGADPKKIQELSLQLDIATANAKKLFAEMDAGSRLLTNIAQSFETNLTSALTSVIDGTKSAKKAFADMAVAILKDIAAMIAKQLILNALIAATGGAGGFFGSLLGARDGGIVEQARNGGVLAEGRKVPGYSSGGVARGSKAGYPAILHGTEAVVPLPNGKSIPVEMQKGGQQMNNVTVNVSMDGGGNGQQNSQSNGQQGANLGAAIATAVQKELQNQKRSGGILNPYGVA